MKNDCLAKETIDIFLNHADETIEGCRARILKEERRKDLINYMYYDKGGITLEQLDAINAWVDHSKMSATEILEKLGEI